MTDVAFLAKMRPGALLVSCGASTTLDERAVADAYASGHLGGLATDGHRWEPVQPDGPLVTLSREPTANVVLTPHSAQADLELTAEMRAPEFTNLTNLLAGRPLEHRVA
jgi:lactate dehydrogenase-like 2-hydroxyacid dehydrogenase